MDRIFVLIRMCILVLSCLGYMQLVCRKIKPDFSISIVFCAIGSVVFLSGILNIMAETSFLVCAVGLYYFVKSVRRKDSITALITPGTVFFLVSSVGMFFMLRGSMFVHDDNFSHWAIATRVLLQNDRFPNFTDVNIAFQSYPLGYASFIYYFCHIVGIQSEWIQMFAQAILMIASLSCLFAFADRRYQSAILLLGSLILLAGNTSFVDLLVDTLLPLVALGGFAFMIYYRDRLSENGWWTIPVIVFLVTIKNSGAFFSALMLVYLASKIRGKSDFKRWCMLVLTMAVTLLLWQKHVDQVFSNGMMSYHSMSVDYFEKMLGMKEDEDIRQILSMYVSKIISLKNGAWIICVLVALMLIAKKFIPGCAGDNSKELILVAGVSYVAYQLMLFGMYLFTMPLNEATRLAGYERYHDTILIFATGIILIGIVQQIAMMKGSKFLSTVLAIVYLCGVFYAITPYTAYYKRQDIYENIRGRYRMEIAEMRKQVYVHPRKRCLVLIDSKTKLTSFMKQLSKFEFDPSKISVQYANKIEDAQKLYKDFDYIIAMDNTEEVNAFMTDVLGCKDSVRIICTIKD